MGEGVGEEGGSSEPGHAGCLGVHIVAERVARAGCGGAWLEGRLNSAERVVRAQCPVILGDLGLSPCVLWG